MIDVTQNLILIGGENKTSQVDEISRDGYGWFYVKFHGSSKVYRYGGEKIAWLTDPEPVDLEHCRIFIHNQRVYDLKGVYCFKHEDKTYWHVVYANDYVQYLVDADLIIKHSCLSDQKSNDVFSYLKAVASTNILGKEEGKDNQGLLSMLYEAVDFIDADMAISPYLNSERRMTSGKAGQLIFPFGCNASQKQAVVRAFENQISIIQGPPGTGKTQTILNIIANIVRNGKTVLVVSNNNSATTNVLDKLNKVGLGFIVAPLGRKENKEAFIENQPLVPDELQSWICDAADKSQKLIDVENALQKLDRIFEIQEKLALSKQELQAIELEWNHFSHDMNVEGLPCRLSKPVPSSRFLELWLQFQAYSEKDVMAPVGWWNELLESLRWMWMNFMGRRRLGLNSKFDKRNLSAVVTELQALYYQRKIEELREQITNMQTELTRYDAPTESRKLTETSMALFKAALATKYGKEKRRKFLFADLKAKYEEVLAQYPVILSTTFSSRICLSSKAKFDYLIMDEASQVSIETGALALMCARNAVVVGDTMQLPNVVTDEDKKKLDTIISEFNIPSDYDCARNSFLQSVCNILPNAPQTLLREHYRCHPRIINFCNQKFYGGNLIIMTEDDGKSDTMYAIKTKEGNHARGHYNQREIDVIRKEVLSCLPEQAEVGIIAPYNAQVKELLYQIPNVESATVHKFQGREKDTIIMSVVDDQITEFSDDPNLLNVAISRAKARFCLVVSGNEQALKGNIAELLSYIEYNNFTVTKSKIYSIFDYMYSQYTQQRLMLLQMNPKVSEYDSENLTFALLRKVLKEHQEFHHLGVLCHIPLRHIVKETSLLTDEERIYAANYSTHVDFLIINHVSKKPVLAVETDGYSFHNKETAQYQRDIKKDHILALYEVPLLRLSTIGSGEEEKIIENLRRWV